MMRFYNQAHRFYCGIDLHARTMYLCVLDQAGAVVFDGNLPTSPDAFRQALAPFRAPPSSPSDLVVCCECMFAWYWLADLCAAEHKNARKEKTRSAARPPSRVLTEAPRGDDLAVVNRR